MGDVRIGGVYQANALIGSYLVSDAYFLAHFGSDWNAASVLVSTHGSAAADNAVSRALAAYPTAQVQTRASSSRPAPPA